MDEGFLKSFCKLVDYNRAFKPHLAIVEGLIGMEAKYLIFPGVLRQPTRMKP
jgi:hypothetical protein